MHVLRNAGRRVQSDGRPDDIDIRLRDPMATQEIASCIRAIDFEALIRARTVAGAPVSFKIVATRLVSP